MQMKSIPFGITDWATIKAETIKGETGTVTSKTCQFGDIRVRMVEYSPGYKADHWCSKGHILLCLEGEMHTETKDGRIQVLRPGVSYQVADNDVAHRSYTAEGAKLFIVD
jgi:quercetin dioxygenase-like cupin family protein